MCNYKVGSKFKLISNHLRDHGVSVGDIVVLERIESDGCHLFHHEATKTTAYIHFSHVEYIDIAKYFNSNRYKLKESLHSTGFNAAELSLASGYNKSYFSSAVSESRFIDRGDLSKSAYNKLDTDLKFAERKLLGLESKLDESGDIKFSPDTFNSVIDNTFFESSSSKNHKITVVNNVTKDYRYAVACIIYIFTVIIGFICFLSWLAVK